MPVTIRMLTDAMKQASSASSSGSDVAYIVNGKKLNVFSLVACVEFVQQQTYFKKLTLNDSSGRMVVHWNDSMDATGQSEEVRVGDYVRVFGHLCSFSVEGQPYVNADFITSITSADEIACHTIRVAQVYLTSSRSI